MEDNINIKKKCFVITPIGNAEDSIRRHVDGIIRAAIKPALGNEFVIKVAHEMANIGSINKQVIEEIFYSDLVIANLTNRNPNVMYELAFRHCIGKPVIQIMEKGTVLPFDIGTERTITYINDSQGVLDLRDEIISFKSQIDFSNEKHGPIYDVLGNIMKEKNVIKELENNPNVSMKADVLEFIVSKIEQLETKLDSENDKGLNKAVLIEFIFNNAIFLNEEIEEEIIENIVTEKPLRIINASMDNVSLRVCALIQYKSDFSKIKKFVKELLQDFNIEIVKEEILRTV